MLVLRRGLEFGDLTDAFGNSLSEEQLGTHLQVLWVFKEPESYHSFLTCAELILTEDLWETEQRQINRC